MNCKQVFECGENLFTKRFALLSYWQDVAENFFPERSDFTIKNYLGKEFATNLMTSYPVLARRDLGNTLGSMLRPTAKSWFHMRTEYRSDLSSRQWLEWAEGVQRRAMYDKSTKFVKATKQGDHDYAAFGQCAIQCEVVLTNERVGAHLLYRNWHLRDMAWAENAFGDIAQVFRRWKPTCRDLKTLFPDKVPKAVTDLVEKDPFAEVDCRHMVVESEMYEDGKFKTPYVSIYYDAEHSVELEVVGIHNLQYVIPRWQTVSNSQYAYSPAVVAALPDARLIQAMTATLLEAGEKMTNPPMLAVQQAIRSDISIYAGGITWVDAEYDERLGEVLRPLTQDKSGMPIGREMQQDTRAMIAEAFYLNKFTMPQRAAEMTAYEVSQRVQEYIRQALPIFEPVEMEYNGGLCEITFDNLMRNGAFGSPLDMPRQLRGAEIQFGFESPLHDAIESEKGQKLVETNSMVAQAAAYDPSAVNVVDFKKALQDALIGVGVPTAWQRSDEEIAIIMQQEAAQKQLAGILGAAQQGADVAKTLGEAKASLAPA